MKRSRHASVYLVAGLTALICAHAGGREAHAAVFSVNSTADGVDAVPGDGVCATILKVCTLRAAVMETNALAGLDTIRLSFSSLPHMLTIPPTSPAGSEEGDAAVGDLDITDALFILPSVTSIAATVDGGHLDRLFHVHQRAEVVIGGVIIQHGHVEHGRAGGAILNAGALALINSQVVANSSDSFAGGISNAGQLTLLVSVVADNRSVFSGGGIGNSGTLVATSSTVKSNDTISFGSSHGGGISNGGTLEVTASTITGNSAGHVESDVGFGGGIWNSGTARLTNSTVSANSAKSSGDGIESSGILLVTNSTIASNSGEGIRADDTATFLLNTIVGNNLERDCFLVPGGSISQGNNLDSDGTCNLAQPNDLSGVNPLLGSLANNGGWTETHALLPGSPAINAVVGAVCPPTDQRGVTRPQGPRCDIGAYEREVRRHASDR